MTSALEGLAQSGLEARPHIVRRLLANPLAVVALSILGVVVVLAAIGPAIAPYSANYADVRLPLAPSSGEHLLGTDSSGRDVLSRLLHATQLTVVSAILCAVVAIGIGLPSGLIAGYYGRVFDSVSGWTAGMLMSLPGIVVLLAARAALGPSVWISMIIFGVLISPGYFRLTRTAVQSVRGELYVDAARVSGLSDLRIITRHILSVVRAPIIIQTAIVVGVAISIQAGLQFLGLGDPSEASWGSMVNEGFRNIYTAPWLIVWPVVMIGATIGALVLLGNAIRDALEDRSKGKRKRNVKDIATGAITAMTPVQRAAKAPAVLDDPDVAAEDRLLEVSGLAIGYRRPDGSLKHVVDDVSVSVARGEVVGIVGESGSGKSQTAFAILGLLPDDAEIVSGSIVFDGATTLAEGQAHVDQAAIRPLRGKRIAYIPQEPMSNLDPNFTVGHQLVRPLQVTKRMSKAAARARALELLAMVG